MCACGKYVCQLLLLESVVLFTAAVQTVTDDKSFSVPSPANKKAVEAAASLIAWCDQPQNYNNLRRFSWILCIRLHACFSKKHSSMQLRKEKMWRAYHLLRTSLTFGNDWKIFLNSTVGLQAHPTFYQHVTSTIFKELTKNEFPLPPPNAVKHPNTPLTFEEKNALRFVAGHVCRKVRTRLEESSTLGKDEMIFCIMSFGGDEEDEEGETELWLNTTDRGGLWHVNDTTYVFFIIMEEVTRRFFSTRQLDRLSSQENPKKEMVDYLLQDEDVLFQWSFLTTSLPESLASALLERIIHLYKTICGFGFATSCVEMFKQHTKQSLQRKKALRKHILL